MPSTLSLVSNMFRDARQRSLAIGVWMACFMGGAAIGTVVGGALLESFWWGSVFLLGVPAMALLLVAGPVLLPGYRDPRAGRLDLASVALSLAAILPVTGSRRRARARPTTLPASRQHPPPDRAQGRRVAPPRGRRPATMVPVPDRLAAGGARPGPEMTRGGRRLRVTEHAQHAVHYAREEAGRLRHDRVGTEHLLLGLLRDQRCFAAATLGGLGIPPETVRRRVEETVGRGQAEQPTYPGHLRTTRPFTLTLGLAGREAMELDHDRLGTEHLLLGLAREGEGVAALVLQELGAGLLELREAVLARYAAGVDPEPFPPDRGPPPWEPPPGARLRRVVPLAEEHPLPSGDKLVLLSLEVWSDWFDLRYAVVYATPEPEGELPRPEVLGACEVSDRTGTEYVNWHSSVPSLGMVRNYQRTFVPSPPPGTGLLELRFGAPSGRPGEAPLVISTVDLRPA